MTAVSVIVNVYNGRATLAEAIDSVVAQTFSDWELLVWDDCSGDGSGEVLRSYDDPRIRYFRSEVQISLGQARQAAIDMAAGEWVAFLDQDDLWLPQKLERQMARVRERPEAALVYGRAVRFYPNGAERDYDQAHEYSLLPEGDIFTSLFARSCYIAMSSAMFRRSALTAIGGVPDSIRIIPDYYLYTAVARRFPAAAVQEAVCRYRMHQESTSQRSAFAMHEEAIRLMGMWQGDVSPGILAKCMSHHSTQMALAEMGSSSTFLRGLRRLVSEGSLLSQLVRPFYYVFHRVRRNLVTPKWKRHRF